MLPLSEITCRIVVAAILGGLIGLEREAHARAAGFRTHILVTVGSCLMMLVSLHMVELFDGLPATAALRVDPGRIAAQAIAAIGFIGAGTIIRMGFTVRGLTTAACLWTAVSIGLALGSGYYNPAFLTTAVLLFTLLFLNRIEKVIPRDWYATLTVVSDENEERQAQIKQILTENRARIQSVGITKDCSTNQLKISMRVKAQGEPRAANIVRTLCTLDGVKSVSWE